MPLPSEKEELWRYTPIDQLDLDAYRPAGPGAGGGPGGGPGDGPGEAVRAFMDTMVADLALQCAVVVTESALPVAIERDGLPSGVTLTSIVADEASDRSLLGNVLDDEDALSRLNDAFLPDVVVIDVAPGTVMDAPVVVVHWCEGTAESSGLPALATFPRTVVRAGRGARASVFEVIAGAPGNERALVVPVTELVVDDGGRLDYVSLQVLGTGAWHLGRLAATAGRDATVRTFTVGLGGEYDRLRTDVAAVGPGAHCELRSAYLGTGHQVHDIRTLQDHRAPHTTSDLLCKGAVAGTSRSVYSGLIRVRRGAVRTAAMQTNHNLVLDERAHADSVPNLDIEENDVRCSHASTVGPVDEDQRYYLESRGVPPERAKWLIVLGFFDDIVDRSPVPEVAEAVRQEVGARLVGAVGPGDGEGIPPGDGEGIPPGDGGSRG